MPSVPVDSIKPDFNTVGIWWDVATGELFYVLEGNYVYSVAFNADSTLVTTCEHDQMLRLWGVFEK